MTLHQPNPRHAAWEYINRGIVPVRIKPREKAPAGGRDWQFHRPTTLDAKALFHDGDNIGALMGPDSGDLVDVDLDCAETRDLAPWFLPTTSAVFGRLTAPRSHWIYRSPGLSEMVGKGNMALDDIPGAGEKERMVELRVGGGTGRQCLGTQTVFPPSIHRDTGEAIEWVEGADEIAVVDKVELYRAVKLLGAAALIARHWPRVGVGRSHNFALAISGFLARAGLEDDEIKTIIEAAADLVGDREVEDRVRTAEGINERLASGEKVTGIPKLIEVSGSEKFVRKLAEWLDYQTAEFKPEVRQGFDRGPGSQWSAAADDDDGGLPFEVVNAAHIGDLSLLPPTEFLLGEQFAKGYVSSTIAPGATGKTAIRIAQALSVATGRELTEEPVYLRCKVLFVCFEDSMLLLKKRVGAAMRHYGVTDEEIDGWLFFAAPGRSAGKLLELDRNTGTMVEGKLVRYLHRLIETYEAELVILDPFKKLHGVGENDNTAMDEVVGILTEIAIDRNVAIDVPQHARKAAQGVTQEAGSQDLARGASSGVDAMRLVYTTTRMSQKEAKDFKIAVERRSLYIRSDNAKVNIAPPSRKATWFRLVGVPLNNATATYRRTDDIGVAIRWYPPDVMIGMDQETQDRILEEIKDGLGDGIYYTKEARATKRNVKHVFARHIDKTDEEVRRIVEQWVEAGLLVAKEYWNDKASKKEMGLFPPALEELRRAMKRPEDEA